MFDAPIPSPRTDRPTRRVVVAFVLVAVVLIGAMVARRGDGDDARPKPSPTTAPPLVAGPTSSTVTKRPEPPPDGVTPDPDSLLVLVDHDRPLPEGYVPGDLVLLKVPFTFEAIDPRRFLRQEASAALDALFAAAKADSLPLLGVSGFRSAQTQAELFDDYAAKDGVAAADRYSARPGHSEHQTGLAIDVVGADGLCPAEPCFAQRPEASWLAAHAHEYGFIVRYPADGEASTGYLYEPWHLRYVGLDAAAKIHRRGETLEHHLGLP